MVTQSASNFAFAVTSGPYPTQYSMNGRPAENGFNSSRNKESGLNKINLVGSDEKGTDAFLFIHFPDPTRTIRTSITLVWVGPVITRPPSGWK